MRKISSTFISIAAATVVGLTTLPIATAQLSSGATLSSLFGESSSSTEMPADSRPANIRELENRSEAQLANLGYLRKADHDAVAEGFLETVLNDATLWSEGRDLISIQDADYYVYVNRTPLTELDWLLENSNRPVPTVIYINDPYGLVAGADDDYVYNVIVSPRVY